MIQSFLSELFGQGKVRVELPSASAIDSLTRDFTAQRSVAADEQLWNQLVAFDQVRRYDFPGEAPALLRDASLWSVNQMHRACVATVLRELSAESLSTFLATPCPAGDPTATHYSVDLVFQFLPDLWRLARRASPVDPLVSILRQWGSQWPLSSIGMCDEPIVSDDGQVTPRPMPVDADSLRVIREHSGLLRCYVDRVIARRAQDRLDDAFVSAAVRVAIAGHESRFPEFAGLVVPRIVP
ncbi:MAG: hypothetical protein U1A77_22085 [Pirellulales bacterium]